MACLLLVCNPVILYICIISRIRRTNVRDWCRFWIESFSWRWGRKWNWTNMFIMISCRSCWILRNVLLLLMYSSSIRAKLHGLALSKSINISYSLLSFKKNSLSTRNLIKFFQKLYNRIMIWRFVNGLILTSLGTVTNRMKKTKNYLIQWWSKVT